MLKLISTFKSKKIFQILRLEEKMILVYFSLWVIFNGRVTLEIIIAGALISFVLDMFVKKILKINFPGASFFKVLKLFPDALFYVIVLIIEIIKANLSITKLVLAPQIEVEPCLVKFTTPLKTQDQSSSCKFNHAYAGNYYCLALRQ